ncbi:unnamed protein product [Mytilus coruscus]|uniref:Uncharacterized protein n=1 Tax=Mytilus coruscus TaxID=42192 RepID=A0A6J8DHZ9_MYTCO|nr:unnamed protein product [Mytilus coruscus]
MNMMKRKDVLFNHMQTKHGVKKRSQKENHVQPPIKRKIREDVDHPSGVRQRNRKEKKVSIYNSSERWRGKIQLQPRNNKERYDLMLFFKEKQVDIVQILEDRLQDNNIKF